MRAVNLIPADSRRGGAGGSGAPWATYALLGGLAAVIALVAVYVLTGNQIKERKAELHDVQARAAAAQAQADRLQAYDTFAQLAQARVTTVRQLASSRFVWHRTLSQLAHVTPRSVWLTAVVGTIAPGQQVTDGSSVSATSPLRQQVTAPAIEMSGCAVSHDEVARYVSRLRLLSGVQRVTLADSQRSDSLVTPTPTTGGAAPATATPAAASGTGADCRQANDHWTQFDVVVFFQPLPTPAAPTTTGTTPSTGTGTTPPAAPGTTPPAAPGTTPPAAPGTAPAGSSTAPTTPVSSGGSQ